MVSVIVPIYNSETYLRRALDSILSQTHKEWEALLIDDGSTDGSGQIADAYTCADRRFRVIHKPNGGRSDARNAGMENVQGEHLIFLDADDFLHPQLMSLCIEAVERDQSDLVCFTYDRRYRTRNIIRHFLHLPDSKPHYRFWNNPPHVVTDDILRYATEHTRPRGIDRRWAVKHCQVWRAMYRTSAVRHIRFISGINYEDFPWWSEVLLQTERATILNLPLYFYYPNPSSYIFSANQAHKVESLRRSILAANAVFAKAPEPKLEAWRRNFLAPFEEKYRKKLHTNSHTT